MTTKDDAMDFAKGLRCQTDCKAVVERDGDVTITLTSNGPGGEDVVTTVELDGNVVRCSTSLPQDNSDEARAQVFDNRGSAESYVVKLVLIIPPDYSSVTIEPIMDLIAASESQRSSLGAPTDQVNDE